jgi:Tfp pilus assembly protein PilX
MVTLMVMLVLSIVGLSLTMISRTELMLSSNERTTERIFYAADSGIALAAAQILYQQRTDPSNVQVADPRTTFDGVETAKLQDRVEVSRSIPILDMPCDLCQVNSGESSFFVINHAVTSVGTREGLSTQGGGQIPLAEATVSAMILVQPWMRSAASLPTSSEELKALRQ